MNAFEQGNIPIDADTAARELIAYSITSSIRGIAKRWLAMDTNIPPAEVAHTVQKLILQGLSGFKPAEA